MERNEKEIKKSFIIVLFLLMVPLFIYLLSRLGMFDAKTLNKQASNIHNAEFNYNYAKNEPDFGSSVKKVTSSAKSVRYERRNGVFKLISPTIDNTARIMCAGDLMCEPVMSKAVFHNDKFFFEQCFAQVKKVFEASDFAIANLETSVAPDYPLAIDKHKLRDRYHCNAPREYLDAVRYSGLDAVVMANNHTCDTGANGLITTIKSVKNVGLLSTGAFMSPKDKRYLLVDINGIKVAFLSYTQHFNSRLDQKCFTDEGRKVMLNMYSKKRVETDLRNAKADGAEFTVVYIHFWCKDYTHNVQDSQVKCANEIAEAGADCIVGGHPHAVQKYDEIITSSGRRVPVNYCLGNFITSDGNIATRTNYIYELFLKKNIKGEVTIADEKIIPCRVVEGVNKSSYIVFPTPKGWRKDGKENSFLLKAENEIKNYVGDKIDIDYNN